MTTHNEPRSEPRRIRVLLAEDDIDLRDGLARLLELDGFQVHTVSDGAKLLEVLASAMMSGAVDRSIDAIVSDVRMPGANGLAIAEGLRAAGWALPIVLISAYADDSMRERVQRIGDVQLLPKPCDRDALEAVLDRAVRHLTTH